MKKLNGAILLIATIIMVSSCGYNSMQQKEENVFKEWGNLEAQLQRRSDLIPNLVATVKGSAKHESETLQAVIEARAKATSTTLSVNNLGDAASMQQFQAAQNSLSSSLSKLMVVVEKYPDLKANQSFIDLQHQLEGTENRITVARKRYNDSVSTFNFSIRKFPNSLTNNMMLNLERKEYFKADEGAKDSPKVEF